MGLATIMVVDDDLHMRSSVEEILKRQGYAVVSASNGDNALQLFSKGGFDCIISDVKMPGMSGIELLEAIREIDRNIPFVIMTAFGDITIAVDAMKKGAYDFIEKGINLLEELEFCITRALQHTSLLKENNRLKNTLQRRWHYIGEDSQIKDIRRLVSCVAQSRSTVLITGESGTGKELVARSIHYLSKRQNGPFVKINCAAMPEGLIESELFGHEKGAFTGAIKSKAGKFELASGGTLLLDEIGDMPNLLQAKLLRVLQEREIQKVGGDAPIGVDVRIIATTNLDLEKAVTDGIFREDLFYRLNVFHVLLPSLKERMSDILALVNHFIDKYNEENGFTVESISKDAECRLMEHTWPGNIRELENAIERAVVLTRTGMIDASMFNFKKRAGFADNELVAGMTVADAEKCLIFKTLEFCNQNRTKAADMLDISIRTLRNKLNEYEKTAHE